MYQRFTEPDMFKHIGNERNTLVCTRIDIEGLRDQRVVLTVPVTKLRYFEDYTLVIRQPVPHSAQGLPLYIRAVEDKAFIPDVSVGFGHKINDDDDGHGTGRHTVENALEANDAFAEGGQVRYGDDGCDDDCVEIIKERIEAKIFPVTTAPFGNLAFGENLTNGYRDEPCPFICLYLNDQNAFVIRRLNMKKGYPHRRLVKVTEVITREPKKYEAIDRDILAVPYGYQHQFRRHDYFIENGCTAGYGCSSGYNRY